ncbi:hypothetical protein [Nocardia wallacei]|uniref:hypothetical protein n=1 Tax=Nocardia wallacei TaxID=480035 RepID=UPI002453975C|nr:hypothetical protein [Nocardia wallacei]
MADEVHGLEPGVLLARVVIERYLDDRGDRIIAVAADNTGQSLDMVTTLGMIEFAKSSFLEGAKDHG